MPIRPTPTGRDSRVTDMEAVDPLTSASTPASPLTSTPVPRPDEPTGIVAIVVAYGAPVLLDRCLAALDGAVPVVVVDNSSRIDVQRIAEEFGATYIDPGRNLGFAGGVNKGLAITDQADVLLLNPDATIRGADVLALARVLRNDPGLAAVAPSQVGPDGEARVAWPFPTPVGAWIEALGLGRWRRRRDFLIGSVLLLRASALADVGHFDSDFFLYAEETDWQRRAADRGWRVALVPDTKATHLGGGTGGDPVGRATHFHASHERYIRKHHGSRGWQVYRSAQLVGAAGRAVATSGERRRAAGHRVRLYRTGPLRVEAIMDVASTVGAPSLHIVHVVVTDGFAGVERYVGHVASGLAERGHQVDVIGGDPDRMVEELGPGVTHHPVSTVRDSARALRQVHGVDLVHAHMTAAEAAAFLARPWVSAPVVATRHFAAGRGTGWRNRALAKITAMPVVHDIAISSFVAQHAGGPCILLPNAVEDRPQALLEARQVVMLQRLDREKAPDVGLRAWAASGLGDQGWRMVVAGAGILRPQLETLAQELGCTSSVEFVGRVDDTDSLLASSSILLAPAPAEPFGLSVAEAMAHGLAVVAAGGGAHLETVGEDGALFPPGDAEAAAVLLMALAQDPPGRKKMGAALRSRQQERFAMPLHLDRLEAIYRSTTWRH